MFYDAELHKTEETTDSTMFSCWSLSFRDNKVARIETVNVCIVNIVHKLISIYIYI